MGLCPDCRNEGETVTYVGGSKDDVLNQGMKRSMQRKPTHRPTIHPTRGRASVRFVRD